MTTEKNQKVNSAEWVLEKSKENTTGDITNFKTISDYDYHRASWK